MAFTTDRTDDDVVGILDGIEKDGPGMVLGFSALGIIPFVVRFTGRTRGHCGRNCIIGGAVLVAVEAEVGAFIFWDEGNGQF